MTPHATASQLPIALALRWRKLLGTGTALLACALPIQALQITRLSPQGEVAQVRQLTAKFDEAAVTFGDPTAPAPLNLNCSRTDATQEPTESVAASKIATPRVASAFPPGAALPLPLRLARRLSRRLPRLRVLPADGRV